MDRVKESLFNIIGNDIFDATFLDLFAGTGSVGIEALSRGAAQAVMLDLDKAAVATVQANVKLARVEDRAVVKRADAFAFLEKPVKPPFDYIFIAPPQYQGMWKRVLRFLDDHPAWVGEDTTVIVQLDPAEREPVSYAHLELDDERKYGKTMLLFYRRPEPPEPVEAPDA
jgi:16S rRNA (guanine(966)-N(2))-methyltransferase RsmD